MTTAARDHGTHPTSHKPGPSIIRWRVLALVVFASSIAYLLRVNMSIAGEGMIADLGLTKGQLGAILAAFAWGYAIFQFPGGVWGDRVGGRKALALTAVVWGVMNLAVGFTPGTSVASPMVVIVSLMALRFLMGAVQGPLNPPPGR